METQTEAPRKVVRAKVASIRQTPSDQTIVTPVPEAEEAAAPITQVMPAHERTAAGASPYGSPQKVEYLGWIVIQANRSANVRSEGSIDSEVVHIVRDGTWYPVLSIAESGWVEIQISKNLSGYISPNLVSRVYRGSGSLWTVLRAQRLRPNIMDVEG